MSIRGAILTVGGSPEPVVHSLSRRRPEFILFVVSEKTRALVAGCIAPQLDYAPQYECVTVKDPDEMSGCYAAIRGAIPDWLRERDLNPGEVYVDITGGTKPMSAALALAAVEWFHSFSYVAGGERNKDGVGVVVSGTESLLEIENPWHRYAVREKERASWLFRQCYPAPAVELLRQASVNCCPEMRAELCALADLAALFADADRFRFNGLRHRYDRNRSGLELIFASRSHLQTLERLDAMAAHWRCVEDEISREGEPAPATVRELLANARRRVTQGRFDDGLARLYRAAELFAQGKLFQAFGASLGKLVLERIPAGKRDGFRERFGQPQVYETGATRKWEGYKFGLKQCFDALALSDDPAQHEVAARYAAIEGHLQKRNGSLLAHGLRPVEQADFEALWAALVPVLDVQQQEVPHWPELVF